MVNSGAREVGEGQDRGGGKGRVIIGLYEIMCLELGKIVKHYIIQRLCHSIIYISLEL